MPKVIRDVKQEQAIARVEEDIREIVVIDSIISSGDQSFRLQSVDGGWKGRLNIAPKYTEKILSILRERRADLVRDARNVAKANKLTFDDSEEDILNGTPQKPPKSSENGKKQTEDSIHADPESNGYAVNLGIDDISEL